MLQNKIQHENIAGFTLVELIVTIFVFCLMAVAFIAVVSTLGRTVKLNREKTILADTASKYLEIVRNLPYSQVGTVHGNPSGSLPDASVPYTSTSTVSGTIYKIYYEVTYIHDQADQLPGNPSYKQIKMDVLNTSTNAVTSFVTTVVPKGIISNPNTGAIAIQVTDASGNPLQGVNIHITYPTSSPTMILDRTTDATGHWNEVGLIPGVNAYRIVVSKTGYSTDQTYPATVQNPNPTKPDITVTDGHITAVSFQIDLLSNLLIKTLDNQCHSLSGIGVNVTGAKLIGTNPNVYKFSNSYTSGPSAYPAGQVVLNNLEWDVYTATPTLATLQTWNVMGTSPIQKINVLPNTNQTFTLILAAASSNSLLAIIKDAATGAALEGATIELQKGGSQPQDYFGTSGGSVWSQTDFSGNSGVAMWSSTTPNTYWQASGGIYINSGPNDVELQKISGKYNTNSTSTLTSSTFDTGTNLSNFTTLSWSPTSQSSGTWLGVQLAANNDNSTWNYVGPDGTANTYYTVSGTNISNNLDNNQYVRFKAYLLTTNNQRTPVLSNIQINYVSGCQTPGQWLFNGITPSNGNAYTMTVSMPGYQTQVINGLQIGGNGVLEIDLSQ